MAKEPTAQHRFSRIRQVTPLSTLKKPILLRRYFSTHPFDSICGHPEMTSRTQDVWHDESIRFNFNLNDVKPLLGQQFSNARSHPVVFIKEEISTTPVRYLFENGDDGISTDTSVDVNKPIYSISDCASRSPDKLIKKRGTTKVFNKVRTEVDDSVNNFQQVHGAAFVHKGVKQENSSIFQENSRNVSSEMVNAGFYGGLKKDIGFKTTESQGGESSMKFLPNNSFENDYPLGDITFEADLPSLDSCFNTKGGDFLDPLDSPTIMQVENNENPVTKEMRCDIRGGNAPVVEANTVSTENLNTYPFRVNDFITTETDSVTTEQAKVAFVTCEVKLLDEALRTRSFAPVAYLLSLLTNGSSCTLSGATSESCTNYRRDLSSLSDDEVSSTSSLLTDYSRRLSPQNSWESDHSSVFSDVESGHRLSEEYDKILLNGGFITAASEKEIIDLLSIEAVQKGLNMQENAFEQMLISQDDGSDKMMDIVTAIDDMMKSTNECDIETFKEVLERENTRKAPQNRLVSKAGTDESTETMGPQTINVTEKRTKRTVKDLSMDVNSNHLDMELKATKQTAQRVGPNRCYHLWDFLRELLDCECSDVVEWTDKNNDEFKLLDTKLLADLWGQKKKLPNMNYDKLSRSLRYYIKLDILRKVPGKRLHFRFGKGRMWKKMKK